MIERYTLPEMGNLWSSKSRFERMQEVEIAVAQVQAGMGIIPKKAAEAIARKSWVDELRILEIEKTTKHDVIAFVSQLAESVGKDGKFIHFGLTSSDVLDTALSLSVRDSDAVFRQQFMAIDKSLKRQINKTKKAICAGRTHGMHGEPTSFGFKLCGYHAEFKRNVLRLRRSLDQLKICKLSGAVGNYSSLPQSFEKKVAKRLKLKPETIATQVVPRDRHAEVLNSMALYASGMERLCVELRHLQRSEVGEVFEGFSSGQKGSSAMPHKKNPITAENVTGLSRMIRAYAQTGLENIVLWHERDLSHSSTERVFFADAFILIHYMNHRMLNLMENLVVDKSKMAKNMNLSSGNMFSSGVLLSLIEKGLQREDAYALIQKLSHGLKAGDQLLDACLSNAQIMDVLGEKRIKEVFSGKSLELKMSDLVDNYISADKEYKI